MGITYEVWEHSSYVIAERVKGFNLDKQPGEGRKDEMSECKCTTTCGISEVKSGKGGEYDRFYGLWNECDDLWRDWGGIGNDQRF